MLLDWRSGACLDDGAGLEDNVANYLDEERIANDAAHDYMSVEHNDVEYYVREA